MGYNKYHNPYVKLQEWNIAVSKQSNVCWIGGISHQYLGKCISNDLLLCIHIPQSAHHETDSNSRIKLDLFPIIDFGNWNRFPSLVAICRVCLCWNTVFYTMSRLLSISQNRFCCKLETSQTRNLVAKSLCTLAHLNSNLSKFCKHSDPWSLVIISGKAGATCDLFAGALIKWRHQTTWIWPTIWR